MGAVGSDEPGRKGDASTEELYVVVVVLCDGAYDAREMCGLIGKGPRRDPREKLLRR